MASFSDLEEEEGPSLVLEEEESVAWESSSQEQTTPMSNNLVQVVKQGQARQKRRRTHVGYPEQVARGRLLLLAQIRLWMQYNAKSDEFAFQNTCVNAIPRGLRDKMQQSQPSTRLLHVLQTWVVPFLAGEDEKASCKSVELALEAGKGSALQRGQIVSAMCRGVGWSSRLVCASSQVAKSRGRSRFWVEVYTSVTKEWLVMKVRCGGCDIKGLYVLWHCFLYFMPLYFIIVRMYSLLI